MDSLATALQNVNQRLEIRVRNRSDFSDVTAQRLETRMANLLTSGQLTRASGMSIYAHWVEARVRHWNLSPHDLRNMIRQWLAFAKFRGCDESTFRRVVDAWMAMRRSRGEQATMDRLMVILQEEIRRAWPPTINEVSWDTSERSRAVQQSEARRPAQQEQTMWNLAVDRSYNCPNCHRRGVHYAAQCPSLQGVQKFGEKPAARGHTATGQDPYQYQAYIPPGHKCRSCGRRNHLTEECPEIEWDEEKAWVDLSSNRGRYSSESLAIGDWDELTDRMSDMELSDRSNEADVVSDSGFIPAESQQRAPSQDSLFGSDPAPQPKGKKRARRDTSSSGGSSPERPIVKAPRTFWEDPRSESNAPALVHRQRNDSAQVAPASPAPTPGRGTSGARSQAEWEAEQRQVRAMMEGAGFDEEARGDVLKEKEEDEDEVKEEEEDQRQVRAMMEGADYDDGVSGGVLKEEEEDGAPDPRSFVRSSDTPMRTIE